MQASCIGFYHSIISKIILSIISLISMAFYTTSTSVIIVFHLHFFFWFPVLKSTYFSHQHINSSLLHDQSNFPHFFSSQQGSLLTLSIISNLIFFCVSIIHLNILISATLVLQMCYFLINTCFFSFFLCTSPLHPSYSYHLITL